MREKQQEEIAAIIGALSAIDMQLQEVEKTAVNHSRTFHEEAEALDTPTSPQFNTAGHLFEELQADIHEIRKYIGGIEEFVRTGEYEGDVPHKEESGILNRTRAALKRATISFQKASDALYVVGRALREEEMGIYADHMQNLSESVEAEARRARSVLESTEQAMEE